MRLLWSGALLAALATAGPVVSVGRAQERAAAPDAERGQAAAREIAAIRAESAAFVNAFNRQNAKAVAALWTADGDYVDDLGRKLVGRDAIEREYAQFFAEHPGHQLRLVIDSVRLLGDSAAVEDGRSWLEPAPPGAPATSRYTALHVKVDGAWRMASVRDTHVEAPSSYRNVADLEWLIGVWQAEEHGAKTESVCRWAAGKSFVERQYTTTQADGTTSSGVQLIGWNPQGGHVQSWSFTSDGGHASGVWSPTANGWQAEIQGMTGDGTPTTATNTLTKLDDNAYAWQSIRRTLGGAPLPDTEEVILKRQAR